MRKKKVKPSVLSILLKSKKLGIALLIIFILILFIFAKKASLYLIFVAVTGILTYIKKLYHLPVDISPLFFLEIVIIFKHVPNVFTQ